MKKEEKSTHIKALKKKLRKHMTIGSICAIGAVSYSTQILTNTHEHNYRTAVDKGIIALALLTVGVDQRTIYKSTKRELDLYKEMQKQR